MNASLHVYLLFHIFTAFPEHRKNSYAASLSRNDKLSTNIDESSLSHCSQLDTIPNEKIPVSWKMLATSQKWILLEKFQPSTLSIEFSRSKVSYRKLACAMYLMRCFHIQGSRKKRKRRNSFDCFRNIWSRSFSIDKSFVRWNHENIWDFFCFVIGNFRVFQLL